MKRIYRNCEMVKVDQNDFDEIMSKRVTMMSSLEEWTLENIRILVFSIGYSHACFCDGYYDWLYDEFGEEYREHDTLESWLKYAGF